MYDFSSIINSNDLIDTNARHNIYTYDDESFLIYDTWDDDFYFVTKESHLNSLNLSEFKNWHRKDGPAYIHPSRGVLWFFNGIKCTFEEYAELAQLSEKERTKLRLMYVDYEY